jgi:hypothetical protein
MNAPPLHVVFSPSAAVDLRKALTAMRRNDRVVALFDDLSFGPIDPPDPAVRSAWVAAELGYDDWDDLTAKVESFWDTAADTGSRHILWLSRRRAADYAGFLEYLWRLGDQPCEVIDLTETMIVGGGHREEAERPHLVLTLALLPAYQIRANNLIDLARPLASAARGAYRAQWQKLRTENAPLRALTPDLSLASAPLDLFDAGLLARVTTEWRKAARVVGEMLMQLEDEKILQTGDLILAARLAAIAAAGRIESKGDPREVRNSEVRLPRAATAEKSIPNEQA